MPGYMRAISVIQRCRWVPSSLVANYAHIQVGKFLLPRPGYPVDYKSEKEMYWHIGEKDVSY